MSVCCWVSEKYFESKKSIATISHSINCIVISKYPFYVYGESFVDISDKIERLKLVLLKWNTSIRIIKGHLTSCFFYLQPFCEKNQIYRGRKDLRSSYWLSINPSDWNLFMCMFKNQYIRLYCCYLKLTVFKYLRHVLLFDVHIQNGLKIDKAIKSTRGLYMLD